MQSSREGALASIAALRGSRAVQTQYVFSGSRLIGKSSSTRRLGLVIGGRGSVHALRPHAGPRSLENNLLA